MRAARRQRAVCVLVVFERGVHDHSDNRSSKFSAYCILLVLFPSRSLEFIASANDDADDAQTSNRTNQIYLYPLNNTNELKRAFSRAGNISTFFSPEHSRVSTDYKQCLRSIA